MRLHFSDAAKLDLLEIVTYYSDKQIRKKGLQIRAKIITATLPLQTHPKLGKVAPVATKKYKIPCRTLINGNYKIVYTIDEVNEFVQIITVFDTRQSPDKL